MLTVSPVSSCHYDFAYCPWCYPVSSLLNCLHEWPIAVISCPVGKFQADVWFCVNDFQCHNHKFTASILSVAEVEITSDCMCSFTFKMSHYWLDSYICEYITVRTLPRGLVSLLLNICSYMYRCMWTSVVDILWISHASPVIFGVIYSCASFYSPHFASGPISINSCVSVAH